MNEDYEAKVKSDLYALIEAVLDEDADPVEHEKSRQALVAWILNDPEYPRPKWGK